MNPSASARSLIFSSSGGSSSCSSLSSKMELEIDLMRASSTLLLSGLLFCRPSILNPRSTIDFKKSLVSDSARIL